MRTSEEQNGRRRAGWPPEGPRRPQWRCPASSLAEVGCVGPSLMGRQSGSGDSNYGRTDGQVMDAATTGARLSTRCIFLYTSDSNYENKVFESSQMAPTTTSGKSTTRKYNNHSKSSSGCPRMPLFGVTLLLLSQVCTISWAQHELGAPSSPSKQSDPAREGVRLDVARTSNQTDHLGDNRTHSASSEIDQSTRQYVSLKLGGADLGASAQATQLVPSALQPWPSGALVPSTALAPTNLDSMVASASKKKKKMMKKKKKMEKKHKEWKKGKKHKKKKYESKKKKGGMEKKKKGKKEKKKWGMEKKGHKKKGNFKKKKWGHKKKKKKGEKKGKKGHKMLKDKGHKKKGFKKVYHKEEWGKKKKWHDIKREKKWNTKQKKWKKKWQQEKGKKYKGKHMKKYHKKNKHGKKYKKEKKSKFKKHKGEKFKKGHKKKKEEYAKKKEGGKKKKMKKFKKEEKKKKKG